MDIGTVDNNVISSIIGIEQDAKKCIEEAKAEGEKILAEAEKEKERLIAKREEKVLKKDKQLVLGEQLKADEKLEEIEQEKQDECSRLDGVYEKRHSGWEEDIFNAVINQ